MPHFRNISAFLKEHNHATINFQALHFVNFCSTILPFDKTGLTPLQQRKKKKPDYPDLHQVEIIKSTNPKLHDFIIARSMVGKHSPR